MKDKPITLTTVYTKSGTSNGKTMIRKALINN